VCPTGKIVVAGGWIVVAEPNNLANNTVVHKSVQAYADAPFFGSSWAVGAIESTPVALNWQLTAYATCAFPPPAP
jgi:hypothetical protein